MAGTESTEERESSAASIPKDDVFELLSNHRRRYALHAIKQTDGSSELSDLAEQVAANHRTADINETHKAMLDFAVKLTESPARIEEADLERLEEHGYSRRAIWDIGSVAAFFNLSNRLAQLADIRPNDEFYDLGR